MLTNATCSDSKLNNHKSLFTIQVASSQSTQKKLKQHFSFIFITNMRASCKSGFSFSPLLSPTEKIVGIVINGAEANSRLRSLPGQIKVN